MYVIEEEMEDRFGKPDTPTKQFLELIIIKILAIVVPVLIAVAFFTVAERKIMGAIQRRRGPNVIGFMGLLQALADGLKLFEGILS